MLEQWAVRLLGGIIGGIIAVPIGIVCGSMYGSLAGWGADNWLPVYLGVGLIPVGVGLGALLGPGVQERHGRRRQ